MENKETLTKNEFEINGVKYKKLNIKSMIINGQKKSFISAEDTKNINNVTMQIITD